MKHEKSKAGAEGGGRTHTFGVKKPKRSINKMNRSRMFLDGVPILYRRGTASHVREIWRAADDEGTIQAWDMVRLFPGRPTLHTTTGLKHALALIGAEMGDW